MTTHQDPSSGSSSSSDSSSSGSTSRRTSSVEVGRVYGDAGASDGARILVDRLWPRGVSKEKASWDEWLKQVAPTAELRTWYGHRPDRFEEFARRYRAELDEGEQREALESLREKASRRGLVLLTATKEYQISAAEVLRQVLTEREGSLPT